MRGGAVAAWGGRGLGRARCGPVTVWGGRTENEKTSKVNWRRFMEMEDRNTARQRCIFLLP